MNSKMRIVAINSNAVFVQKFLPRAITWTQTSMTYEEFDEFMKAEYPNEYKEYKKSGSTKSAAEWFYNYGETESMRRKGEVHVY